MASSRHFAIVGGGIVGLATAYKLLQAQSPVQVTVYEKEARVGQHQSGNNSGVLHAGLYYKPGSLKARLAVSGIRQMVEFCREHSVPHEICGKLVIATSPAEEEALKNLAQRGEKNRLTGLRLLSGEELRRLEPHAAGSLALHVPEEGIVDYREVCASLMKEILRLGGRVSLGKRIRRIQAAPSGWVLATDQEEMPVDYMINCAGLHSDRVATMAGEESPCKIIPFRGEYYRLSTESQSLVRNLIYPVPNPAFPFLGVHFTRLIRGGVEAGPNAVLAGAREGYRKTQVNVADLAESISYPGLWRFLARHRNLCWQEFRQSWSKRLFCAALQRLVPEMREENLTPGGAGVRAQAMDVEGNLLPDFSLIQRPHALHVINAPSPGATASLAIADEIVRLVESSR